MKELFKEFCQYRYDTRKCKGRRLIVLMDILLYGVFVLAMLATFLVAALGKFLLAIVLISLPLLWLVICIPIATGFEQWLRDRYNF